MSIDPKNIKVLLVEDTDVMRKIEIKTLQSLGFEKILEAQDGNIAIEKLQKDEDINLIISDWNMPNKDGYELLVWVREHGKNKEIPFLMATGQADRKQAEKAISAGVSSFVAKPFNGDELRAKIDEAFGIKQEEKEISQQEKVPKKTASGKVRLRVAHIQITDHLVLGVLKHLIKEGQLTPRHFELETQSMTGWNPVEQALEKGTVDAACILAPIAMDLFSVGIPIKLILLAHKNGSIFVRSKQGEYRKPLQDFFKKKSFLIPHKMSVHHMLAHLFFSKIGLNPGVAGSEGVNVNFEVVAPIKMAEYLSGNSSACGFMVAEPLGTKSIAAGIAQLQFLSSELWENHPCCVVTIRDDFVESYGDAVYEFTELLVEAGKFIEKKPEMSARIAVSFLDPNKKLGLKVPILKNVLTEAQGIKTGNLFPVIEDLDKMQQYMFNNMGIGSLIDLEKFVDTRFAEAACKDKTARSQSSNLRDTDAAVLEILNREAEKKGKTAKAMLHMEGKYLILTLDKEEYGISILQIREILGMQPVTMVPRTPKCVKGVINLRGQVIPVMDLRSRLGMDEIDYNERTCIIVTELNGGSNAERVGVIVDSVSEVQNIKAEDIEETTTLGTKLNSDFIFGMAKTDTGVRKLLNIGRVGKFNVSATGLQ